MVRRMSYDRDESEEPVNLDDMFLKTFHGMFEPAARRANPPPIHWITDAEDSGSDYCQDCAEKIVKTYKREFPDAFVDGGWDAERDSDTPANCCSCGKLLGYTLTKEGILDELHHWTSIGDRQMLDDDCCYEIYQLIDTVMARGKPSEKAECKAVAQKFITLIPQAPETDEVPADL